MTLVDAQGNLLLVTLVSVAMLQIMTSLPAPFLYLPPLTAEIDTHVCMIKDWLY